MTISAEASVIEKALIQRRLPSGGWSFLSSEQASVEATCLAGLALGSDSHGNAVSTVRFLKSRSFGWWVAGFSRRLRGGMDNGSRPLRPDRAE